MGSEQNRDCRGASTAPSRWLHGSSRGVRFHECRHIPAALTTECRELKQAEGPALHHQPVFSSWHPPTSPLRAVHTTHQLTSRPTLHDGWHSPPTCPCLVAALVASTRTWLCLLLQEAQLLLLRLPARPRPAASELATASLSGKPEPRPGPPAPSCRTRGSLALGGTGARLIH
jgi:hypothetical protein